jgi:NADPH:quinone reductase-like Zn-dependent oxidoreductase
MAAIGLSVDDTLVKIAEFEQTERGALSENFAISCINSPRSVTISGSLVALVDFTKYLAARSVFARLLKVGVGYHSPQMSSIASQYGDLMGLLRSDPSLQGITMVSSVTGTSIDRHHVCHRDYWVRNMVSTVNFLAATQFCCQKRRGQDMRNLDGSHADRISVDVWLEIGPHSALHGPIKQVLQSSNPQVPLVYTAALVRDSPALSSLLNAIGCLWVENVGMDMRRSASLSYPVGHLPRIPPSLPAYPFNHSILYWEEPQANLDFRLRNHPCHDLAGTRFGDLRSVAEAQWRFRIKLNNMPWVQDHKIQGSIIYPAAGSIAMVLEAAKQLLGAQNLTSLELKDVEFSAPIHVTSEYDTQIVLHLSAQRPNQTKDVQYSFRAFSTTSEAAYETLVCCGIIRGHFGSTLLNADKEQQMLQDLQFSFQDAKKKCPDTFDDEQLYERLRTIGLEYGPTFKTLTNISYGIEGHALATCRPLPSEVVLMTSPEFTVHPSRLDGVFQLGFAAMASADSIRAMVPTRIERLSIPVAGFGHNDKRRETAHCQAIQTTERNAHFSIAVFDEATLELKAHVEGLELTALAGQSEDRKRLEDAPSLTHQVQWKPDLAAMSTNELTAYTRSHESGQACLEWVEVLHSLTLLYATLALQSMRIREQTCGSCTVAPSMTDYAQWLSRQVDVCSMVDPKKVCDLLDTLPSNSVVDSYINIGKNLPAILSGHILISDLLPPRLDTVELIQELDGEIGITRDPLGTYIDCLTHKHPDLHFCEIGARLGTVATCVLDPKADSQTARRYGKYTIVDVEDSNLEYVRKQLSIKEQVDFKIIDRSLELSVQEFIPQSFDIIIINMMSDSSLGDQAFIDAIIELLKPSGKLIVRQIPQANFLWNFLLGLSSNPFLPVVHAPDLKHLLQRVPLPQTQVPVAIPQWSATVYYGQEGNQRNHSEFSHDSSILIVDPRSDLQQAIGNHLCKVTGTLNSSNILSLSDVTSLPDKAGYDFILLVELEEPWLSNIHREDFEVLKEVLRDAKSLLWVNKANDIPEYALNEGLLRVSRHENEKTAVVSLSLETDDRHPATIAKRIHFMSKRLQEELLECADEYEPEYREYDGLLNIPRCMQAREHDKHIFSCLEKPLVRQNLGDKKLRLGLGTLGVLDTLEFGQDDSAKAPIGSGEVEIAVQAIGVNFKDLMGLLGRATSKNLGSELAGIVTAVGGSVMNVVPGDRVVAAYVDAYRTHARVPWQVVYRIPNDTSFEAAASIPTVFRTAYFCLYSLARLQQNESILIHRASGGTGQAAIQLSQGIGATTYVTVGSKAKKQLLMERYGIPEQHILNSRSASFGSAIKRLTRGRGVDVVLNSLGGELLETSWDCVAPFGRFIEIGLGDAYARQQLPMFNFSKGVSFMSFNLANFMEPEWFDLHIPLMKSVWDLFIEKKIHPPYPLHLFPVGELEGAFRLLNSGDSSGKIVIQMDKNSIVPVCWIFVLGSSLTHSRLWFHISQRFNSSQMRHTSSLAGSAESALKLRNGFAVKAPGTLFLYPAPGSLKMQRLERLWRLSPAAVYASNVRLLISLSEMPWKPTSLTAREQCHPSRGAFRQQWCFAMPRSQT